MTPITIGPESAEIPPGDADARITAAATGKNRTGSTHIRVDLEDAQNRYLTDFVTVTERAMWRVKQLWSAAGLPWPGTDGGRIDERELVGKVVHITVEPEEYEGVTRVKVKEYAAAVGGDIPVDPPANNVKASNPFAAAVNTGGGGQQVPEEDDIPFDSSRV